MYVIQEDSSQWGTPNLETNIKHLYFKSQKLIKKGFPNNLMLLWNIYLFVCLNVRIISIKWCPGRSQCQASECVQRAKGQIWTYNEVEGDQERAELEREQEAAFVDVGELRHFGVSLSSLFHGAKSRPVVDGLRSQVVAKCNAKGSTGQAPWH